MNRDRDIVIGVDSSTTATKAVAWDAQGSFVAEGRSAVPMHTPKPGWYEQDPEAWWGALQTALHQLWLRVSPERVAALAIANQRETVAALLPDGSAARPAILWLDERCAREVVWLSSELGRERLHALTGRPPDMTTAVYSVAWMLRHERATYQRVSKFVDVSAYLTFKLTDLYATSWASADPLGTFDIRKRVWADEILTFLNLTPEHFCAAQEPGTVMGEVTRRASEATGLRVGTPLVAGGGDGQCAGLGLNTTFPGRAYLNLGTAVVSGVFSPQYRIDNAFRTLVASGGDGYILETLLRSGTFLLNWFLQTFGATGVDWATLEADAKGVALGSDGLLLVPHWSGSATPHWDDGARGVLLGLSGSHGRPHVYRALLEGIALEQGLMSRGVEAAGGEVITEVVLTGGGAQSKLWCKIIADVLGKRVLLPEGSEATTLGAGILAAVGAEWYKGAPEAASAMTRIAGEVLPDAAAHARYAELLQIYSRIYPAIKELNAALTPFRGLSVDKEAFQ